MGLATKPFQILNLFKTQVILYEHLWNTLVFLCFSWFTSATARHTLVKHGFHDLMVSNETSSKIYYCFSMAFPTCQNSKRLILFRQYGELLRSEDCGASGFTSWKGAHGKGGGESEMSLLLSLLSLLSSSWSSSSLLLLLSLSPLLLLLLSLSLSPLLCCFCCRSCCCCGCCCGCRCRCCCRCCCCRRRCCCCAGGDGCDCGCCKHCVMLFLFAYVLFRFCWGVFTLFMLCFAWCVYVLLSPWDDVMYVLSTSLVVVSSSVFFTYDDVLQ